MRTGPDPRRARDAANTAVRSLVRRIRLRQGWARVRSSFWPIVQASLAAGAAYGIAHTLLGHAQPFFAAVAAWVCLGFSFDRELRRVAEVAAGVAVGVGMGELVVEVIGSGWWQLTVVLLVSALLARFLDRGPLLVTQAGVQAIVVVGLPFAMVVDGAFGRWTDAAIGGLVALVVTVLTPGDPRRRLRAQAAGGTSELAETLESVARGLRNHDADELAAALVRGRASEPVLADWRDAARKSADIAQVSVNRGHWAEFSRLAEQAVLLDRAMRSVRVLARRAPTVVAPDGTWPDVAAAADLVDRFAGGVRLLSTALEDGSSLEGARALLLEVAAEADPREVGGDDLGVASLVVLLRAPVVDTLEAAGLGAGDARAALPEL
ncbi:MULTISPECIES: aromatic acid exporter family protein [unclassified Isoptericola]|uniref:FUSC family protein n=1 Tax=unclassified Isoptericola TaxID=2623355 RepID=UPI0027142D2D|nr:MULTISPECIES: FUSC family protein [unclassified Isoptericola]MDO8145556.1 FUSC family protein [Isoptericola sp. 178]MDO8149248.1 FUSC family protein [Isoptericola sp. b515]